MKCFLLPDYLILSFDWNVTDILQLCENVYSAKLPCYSNITIMSAVIIPFTSLFWFFFLACVWKKNRKEDDILSFLWWKIILLTVRIIWIFSWPLIKNKTIMLCQVSLFSEHGHVQKCQLSILQSTHYYNLTIRSFSLDHAILSYYPWILHLHYSYADRGNKGETKTPTRLFFLLAAPLGSCIEQHLLHLLQLLLQTVEVEVSALLCHGRKVCRST